jgi:hypothetical protein
MSKNVKISWNSVGVISVVANASQEAVRDIIGQIETLAKEQVPVESGDLKASGRSYMEGDTGVVIFDAKHALVQHEDIEFRHKEGQNAKYLENPFNQLMPHMNTIMQQIIIDDLK